MELPPEFEFNEARKDELPNLFSIWNIAFADYQVWKVIFKDSEHQKILPWIEKTFGARMKMDDIALWKITEVSSGWALTSRM